MAVKLQILRCNRMTDISLVTENKLRELRDMVGTAALRDEITQVKANLSVVRILALLCLFTFFGYISNSVEAYCGHQSESTIFHSERERESLYT